MTKSFFIVGLLLLLVSCNDKLHESCLAQDNPEVACHPETSEDTPADTPAQTPDEPEAEEPSTDVPQAAFLFDADIRLTNFDAVDESKMMKAIEIIKKVIRTSEFRERVINFTYQGKKQFVENKGLSNEEIYLKLLDASEELRPDLDHQMDLDLELYYSSRTTVGYTYPNTMRIWINTKYFDKYSLAEVAGNVFHEWSHKLGFGHSSSYTSSRDYSVPYALGYIVEELGKKYE